MSGVSVFRLLVITGLLFAGVDCLAQQKAPPLSTEQARRLVIEGMNAAQNGRLADARLMCEQAFRAIMSPDAIYCLGRAAQAGGRVAQSADLFRRYLDLVGDQADEASKKTITEHLAKLSGAYSEVRLTAPDGAWLLVDQELVGHTPLPGPMLLKADSHRFTIELPTGRFSSDTLVIPEARSAQLNLTPATNGAAIAVMSLSPLSLLALSPPSLTKSMRDSIWRTVGHALAKEQAALVAEERLHMLLQDQSADCLNQAMCQESIAEKAGARSVIHLQATGGKDEKQTPSFFSVQIYDIATGQEAAHVEIPCNACSTAMAMSQLGEGVRHVIAEANNRPRGMLAVTGKPAGARVLLGRTEVGRVPMERLSFVGKHSVTIEQAGFQSHLQETEVVLAQTTTVQVSLKPDTRNRKRPLWRLFIGSVVLAGGVATLGTGISGLIVDNQCKDGLPPVNQLCADGYYNTAAIGGGLVGAGLALSVGGTLLLAWPGSTSGPASRTNSGDLSRPPSSNHPSQASE